MDGLRAVAVLAVIAHHFSSALLPSGFLGVDMFFVISGYVITASLAKHPHDSLQDLFLGFYARRVKRLLPALVLCVLVTCVIGSLFINPEIADFSHSMKAGLFSLLGASNIYFYNKAIDYFGSSAPLNLFTHTWSLGVEEQFYLVFPALFWVSGNAARRTNGRRFFLRMLGFLTALSFALYIWLNWTAPVRAYFMMPPRFWELSLGCMIAVGWSHLSLSGRSLTYAPWLGSAVLAIAFLAPSEWQFCATAAAVVASAVLIVTLRPEHPLYKLLTVRSVLLLGMMSYSLYLWHWSVLSISRWTIGIHWWSAPVQLGAMLGLAALSYVYVERPLRRADWSTSKAITIGYGLVALACSAGAIMILKSGYIGVLYTGAPVQLAAKGGLTLMEDKWLAGRLQWRARNCILSSNEESGKHIDASTCTLAPSPTSTQRQFLVIGNSFSAAEFEMYSGLSEAGLGSVIATSSWAASPVQDIPNTSPFSKANEYYWNTVIPALTSRLGNGDFLIMINDLAGFTPAAMDQATEDRLAALSSGLNQLAKELRQKGVHIIFQSQNPLMRESQCTPEMAKPQWFNLGDRCTYNSKAESIKRIQPLRKVLEDVQSVNPNFHILDLFPVLCPEEVCKYYNSQGVFLYRDEWSHPSVEANYLARPILLSIAKNALEASEKQHAEWLTSKVLQQN